MDHVETNCKLPEDLFRDILSRLSVRDLLRFRSVSKSWCALIDDPSFILTHHFIQYAMHKANGDVPLLLWRHTGSIRGYQIECYLFFKQQGYDTISNWTSDVERYAQSVFPTNSDINLSIFCRGSANGIICLDFQGIDLKVKRRDFYYISLWNPATRDFKIVVYPHVADQRMPGNFVVVGFGYDPVTNDYKIVATTVVSSDIVLVYMVYTLSTNSWKRVNEPSLFGSNASVRSSLMDSCLNGVYYWTAHLLNNIEDKIFRILSFNFSTEAFIFSDPPQEALPHVYLMGNEFYWNIGLYNERLALFLIHPALDTPESSADIWVATEFDDEFGVPVAWQCLISIKPIFERIGSTFGAQWVDGDIVFQLFPNEFCLYNPTTGKFRRLGISFRHCFSYVESLFPLSRRVA